MIEISWDERSLARAELQRFAVSQLSPVELDAELGRWLAELENLKAEQAEPEFSPWDAATIAGGIAYAEHQVETLTRRLQRYARRGARRDEPYRADFEAARYADLAGLAETLLGEPLRRAGRKPEGDVYRIRCPFHDDRTPSLLIYPPGKGWWCPVCHKGGRDAASFCAEYFGCSQVEGLRWVEQLALGVRGAA